MQKISAASGKISLRITTEITFLERERESGYFIFLPRDSLKMHLLR